ncbi:hypothetical protein T459_27539 [Capsicum annuum]|uniref:DCC family protein At1g52590, chloroplastic n=1 Tax=Capsicum annuum TaxID=4072 RepID=A0A2G2YE76_CAPAN|nr:uncharacterized protein YuxK [Capsicum annuum]PHT68052.1 hypothetical protein T459_27539 [Capsicum annuum]
MMKRGLRLLLTGKLNCSAPLIYRRQHSSSASLNGGVSASAVDFVADDIVLGDQLGTTLGPKMVTGQNLLQPGVVVYDGVCHLCHNGVKWVIKADKDRKIKFCCLQSKAAEPYMSVCDLDRDDVRRRFLFVEGPGLYHQGSTAALRVLAHLPFPYSALSYLTILPAPLRDAVYDHVAKKRYKWFGKSDDCLVLREQDLLDRFIDREELLERSRSVL